MIEIVGREPCPTCGGTKRITVESQPGEWIACPACHGDGTIPRMLTTFADAAALANAIEEAMCVAAWGTDRRSALLAALGVSDDQG